MTVVGGESLGSPVLLPLSPEHPPRGPGRILTEDSRESGEEAGVSRPRAQPEDSRRLHVPWRGGGSPHGEARRMDEAGSRLGLPQNAEAVQAGFGGEAPARGKPTTGQVFCEGWGQRAPPSLNLSGTLPASMNASPLGPAPPAPPQARSHIRKPSAAHSLAKTWGWAWAPMASTTPWGPGLHCQEHRAT